MDIFPILKSDDVVFTGDKIRFAADESFLAPGIVFAAISHEISTDGGITWYNITAKKYVDWIFTTSGVKTISLRINTTLSNQVITKNVAVLDLTTQKLFSKDNDLYSYETDIDQYLPKKWSSWNLVHLNAQKFIVDWLDEKGLFSVDGKKYTKDDITDVSQVRQFSVFKTLEFIFDSNIKIVDDYFTLKRDHYRRLADEKSAKSQLALDYNKDTINNDEIERTNLFSVVIKRS